MPSLFKEDTDEVELTAEGRYVFRTCGAALVAFIILGVWAYIKTQMESATAVNIRVIQLYEQAVLSIVYAIIIISWIVFMYMACKEKEVSTN
jgi:hypothetical protein